MGGDKKKMKLRLMIYLALTCCACSTDSDQQSASLVSDFDHFCQAFKELTAQSNYHSLNSEEKHAALMDLLSDEVQAQSHAYIAWDAVRFADAHERYNLFIDAAAASGHNNWTCGPMKQHAHEVGRP